MGSRQDATARRGTTLAPGGKKVSKREVSKEALRAVASMTGLELGEDKLDRLLPQVQDSVEAIDRLDTLDLQSVEPAIAFIPESE